MRSKTHLVLSALNDIQKNILRAQKTTADLDLESFSSNWEKSYIVIRCLEIISEASRRLPEEMRVHHPHIQWQDIASAGNFYRHRYSDVGDLRIWNTVKNDLPPLLVVIEAELARYPKPE